MDAFDKRADDICELGGHMREWEIADDAVLLGGISSVKIIKGLLGPDVVVMREHDSLGHAGSS